MNSRDKILKTIKSSLKTKSHLPDIPKDTESKFQEKLAGTVPANIEEKIEQFKHELELVSAEFFRLKQSELLPQLQALFKQDSMFSISGGELVQSLATELSQEFDFVEPDSAEFDDKIAKTDIGLVDVTYAIAETGTLVIPFSAQHSTLPHVLPETIFALVHKDQLLANLFELFDRLPPESAKHMLMVTGPSRTADIEKILILGAHGPKRLVVLFYE